MIDKIAVITGASKGLGKALARRLDKEGIELVLNVRSEESLKAYAGELNALYFVGNVANEKDMRALADFAIKKFGKIDVWINNAGVWYPPATSIIDFDSACAHELIETNLFGTIFGSRAAAHYMVRQNFGTIVNILSTTALDGKARSHAYGADKFGAKGFTFALRDEVREKNLSVIAVYPGGMKTNIFTSGKPYDYGDFLEPDFVAEKIVNNLLMEKPEEELVIRRN